MTGASRAPRVVPHDRPAGDRHPGIEAGSGYRPGFDLELHLNDCSATVG